MPCNDITEILKFSLDRDGRFKSYSLAKQSCGFSIGDESLIAQCLINKSVQEILSFSVDSFLGVQSTNDQFDMFIQQKHLDSIKKGLAALTGRIDASATDDCSIDSIEYCPDGIEAIVYLKLPPETDRIESCNKFTCGRK